MARNDNCQHPTFEVRTSCPDCGKEFGHQVQQRVGGEAANQRATELPDREAMSLANINLAAPINIAAALNVLSDGSIAYAGADQTAPVNQGIL